MSQNVTAASDPSTSVPLISAKEARRRVAAGAVLVDVRSPEGRARTGAISEAVIADKQHLTAEFDLQSPGHLGPLESARTPIVVICGSVNGSGPAAEVIAGQGFVDVVHVDGGAAAWFDAGDAG